MKIKVSETTRIQLDWLVAKCLGIADPYLKNGTIVFLPRGTLFGVIKREPKKLRYSTDPAQGQPILEREKIGTFYYIHGFNGASWNASIGSNGFSMDGPTMLIAGLRCYVASRMGDEVEIPEELL